MKAKSIVVGCAAIVGVWMGTLSIGADQPAAPAQPAMQLPPGWTEADMQKAMAAGTPGKEHQQLAALAGDWKGKVSMWMAPGTPENTTEMTWKMTSIMDGRFLQTDVKGEWPNMGPFIGHGITGYDNVAKSYSSTWIDNWGTMILTSTGGTMSPDGKTCSIAYTMQCPIQEKPVTLKEVMTLKDASTLVVEMHTTEPKSGKEYLMLKAELKR